MNPPEPKTIRGKCVRFVLYNLPGLLFILLLLGLALFVGQRIEEKKARLEAELKEATAVENPPVNVVTLKLEPTVLRDKINLPGVIEAWTSLDLMAKIGGSIEEVFVKEGDQVQKGQLIARLESKDYQIALDSAKAAYELAQLSFARNKTLRSKGISTQANLDELQSQLRQAKANVENAQLQLSRCRITAPISGVISRLDAKVGSVVNQMVPASIAEILALDQVKAIVSIPEADVTAVRKLDKVEIEIQALDNEKVHATVYFLAPMTDTKAHVYRLELRVPNKDHRILPGMFVRANIVKRVQEQALALPLFSVISRNKEQFVYVEEQGIAYKKAVKIGFLEGWQVLITDGLKAGEQVIIEGHRSVEDGQAVKVVKTVSNLSDLAQ